MITNSTTVPVNRSILLILQLLLLTTGSMLAVIPGPGSGYHTWLDSWGFDNTNTWPSDLGYAPVSYTNLAVSNLGDGANLNALVVDSTNAAWLQYNVVESDNTTNLCVGPEGSLMLWFAPNWSGTNQGGTGPGVWGRLIEVGTYTTNASFGWWSVYTCPAGDTLFFAAQGDNGSQAIYLTAPIQWTTNRWQHLALTYSSTNTALYLDGDLVTNGLPLTIWPGGAALAGGLFFGSDSTGLAQAHGWFDDITTYNFVLDPSAIQYSYRQQSIPFHANPMNMLGNLHSAPSTPVFTPALQAITGPGYFMPPITNTSGCVTSSNVWLTNVVATVTNQNVTLKFTVAGGSNGVVYDVFATSALGFPLANAQWAWMGQVYHCCTYTLTNLPVGNVFLLLGTPQDQDGDGLTDAQELLITHTDPNNSDTFGTGMSDGWQLAYFGSFNVDFYTECPFLDGWTIGQAYQNGWNPRLAYTPPAPTGLSVYYYGPGTNITLQWNPSPGSVLIYTIERALPGAAGTTYFTNSTVNFQDVLPSGYPDNGAPVYRVMASYPSGPSAWSTPVSIYQPELHLDPQIVRGPQGNLYLVTGHVPSSVAKVRLWATADYAFWGGPYYPSWFEANYLWEEPQLFTNTLSSNYCELDVTAFQSGFTALPTNFISLYGYYDFKVQTVGNNGTVSDSTTLYVFAVDGWSMQAGAIPFLDGRQHIQQNVEFQLRAAQGRYISTDPMYPPFTNETPFSVSQLACDDGVTTAYSESGFVDYVTAGFHCYSPADRQATGARWPGFGLDAFRPFEQNYFYANFLIGQPWGTQPWADLRDCSQSFPASSLWFPYVPASYIGMPMEVDQPYSQFSVWNYVAAGGTNPIPGMLSPSAAQWIFQGADVSSYFASEAHQQSDPYKIYADFPNLYGLNLLSVKAQAWNPWTGPPGTYQTLYPGDTLTSGHAYFYNVERPQLATVAYYFAREKPITYTLLDQWGDPYEVATNLDARPGEPGFSTDTATAALIFASFGQPFFVSAWAKQSMSNGFNNVFAYPEQYFDQAYTIDQNGQVTTNGAGILSPYGEFLPTMPGPIALVTMPDAATGSRGTGVVNVIKLQLDVNHDRKMDLSLGGPDNATANHPFVFWINNDYDRGHTVDITDYEEDDLSSTNSGADCPWNKGHPTPDCEYRDASGNRVIPSERDLEDFARLWVCGPTTNLLSALPPGSTVTLSWGDVGSPNSGNPTIDLFQAFESAGGIGYLTNLTTARLQTNASICQYVGRLRPGQSIQLNSSRFSNNWAGEHLIWCGVSNGTGALTLTISQGGTNTLAQTTAYIQLQDIKQMYERWTVGDNGTKDPTNMAFLALEDLPAYTTPFQYSPSTDPNTPYILHVHGWNMDRWEKDRFGETMFKRLYWQGYQGRFGIFRWPTLTGFPSLTGQGADLNHFDKSEQKAWKSGAGLRNLLVALNAKYPGQVRLTAHSMGNIVAGEALRTNTALAAIHVAMQAALPAGAYDMAAPFRAIPYPYFDGTTELYRFYPVFSPSRPYFYQVAGAGVYVDFYNPLDWALSLWQTDQNLKPDDTLGYTFDISTGTFYQYQGKSTQRVLTCPTNTYELFAYCVEGQCWALGAQINVGGVFDKTQQLDLNAAFSFGSAHKGHSGQFRSTYMDREPFWNALGNTLGVLP